VTWSMLVLCLWRMSDTPSSRSSAGTTTKHPTDTSRQHAGDSKAVGKAGSFGDQSFLKQVDSSWS
jgi:hypothetical protein